MTFLEAVELVTFLVVLLALGILCLVWPDRIQQYALKRSYLWFNPVYEWMKKPSYRVSTRLLGVMSLIAVALMLWALLSAAFAK